MHSLRDQTFFQALNAFLKFFLVFLKDFKCRRKLECETLMTHTLVKC